MDSSTYSAYLDILHSELVVAMGCTEPIAIAYAGAKAREILGVMPTRCIINCSGNIIKNVMGVTVPNSGGMKGIEAAAVLGILGGEASRVLEVLSSVTEEHRRAAKALLSTDFCRCSLISGVDNLNVVIRLEYQTQYVELEIRNTHSNITRIEKDGETLLNTDTNIVSDCLADATVANNSKLLNVRDILEFADTVRLSDIEAVIKRQIEYNTAISEEGLAVGYGAEVGRTLLSECGDHPIIRAAARAAAGSDARMSGCALPVVINSGSGNQGITVTMPVVEYAKELGVSQEKLYRAMVISNLISIHQKKYIGRLSAYCGAVNAACGSGAAICYLMGCSTEEICDTITNTIANVGGIVCDGAKPSCAAKIASAVQAAMLGVTLSRNKKVFRSGEGLVKKNIEETIASIGRVGKDGMKSTDEEILQIMLEK